MIALFDSIVMFPFDVLNKLMENRMEINCLLKAKRILVQILIELKAVQSEILQSCLDIY